MTRKRTAIPPTALVTKGVTHHPKILSHVSFYCQLQTANCQLLSPPTQSPNARFYVTIRKLGSRNKKKAMDPMTTSPKRTFIGWTKPILQEATERLFASSIARKMVSVGPSSLASRAYRAATPNVACKNCWPFAPTKHSAFSIRLRSSPLVTLPEHLYLAKFPFASDMVQILAWCEAHPTNRRATAIRKCLTAAAA